MLKRTLSGRGPSSQKDANLAQTENRQRLDTWADRNVRRQTDRFCPVSDTKVYLAVEFPGKYALPYWLTAIVMSALVVTLPSEICKDTALPVGVPAGMATLI